MSKRYLLCGVIISDFSAHISFPIEGDHSSDSSLKLTKSPSSSCLLTYFWYLLLYLSVTSSSSIIFCGKGLLSPRTLRFKGSQQKRYKSADLYPYVKSAEYLLNSFQATVSVSKQINDPLVRGVDRGEYLLRNILAILIHRRWPALYPLIPWKKLERSMHHQRSATRR